MSVSADCNFDGNYSDSIVVWFKNIKSSYGENLTCTYGMINRAYSGTATFETSLDAQRNFRCPKHISLGLMRTAVIGENMQGIQKMQYPVKQAQLQQDNTQEPSPSGWQAPITGRYYSGARTILKEPFIWGGALLVLILIILIIGLILWRR